MRPLDVIAPLLSARPDLRDDTVAQHHRRCPGGIECRTLWKCHRRVGLPGIAVLDAIRENA